MPGRMRSEHGEPAAVGAGSPRNGPRDFSPSAAKAMVVLVAAIVLAAGLAAAALRRFEAADRPRPALANRRGRIPRRPLGPGPQFPDARLERLRPRTGLDLMLEAQLAVAEAHPGRPSRASPGSPTITRSPPRPTCWPAGSGGRNAAQEGRGRIPPGHRAPARAHRGPQGAGVHPRHPVARREVDAEFRQLARLTRLSHHDLFTWALPTSPTGTPISWPTSIRSSLPTPRIA